MLFGGNDYNYSFGAFIKVYEKKINQIASLGTPVYSNDLYISENLKI